MKKLLLSFILIVSLGVTITLVAFADPGFVDDPDLKTIPIVSE